VEGTPVGATTGLVLSVLLLVPCLAGAWESHCLMTDRALKTPAEKALVGQTVEVEGLEDFLKAEGPGLAREIAGYYGWLDVHGVPGRHVRRRYDPATPTRTAFLAALRLNPTTAVPYVLRLLPPDPRPKDVVPLHDVSAYLKPHPPLLQDFNATPPGSKLTVAEVLRTYSDEPDWGMDRDLWNHPEYGYGAEPYGKPTGVSSQAAFHMKFAHEPWLVRTFVPRLADGMPIERIELFTRLARFAFRTGHAYWGWRFGAWALHYVQDLAQPYHARAFPGAGAGYYLRYILSFHKAEMKARATQLVENRHFLYEDFAAYALQRSYCVDAKPYADLARCLSSGPSGPPGGNPAAIADAVMASAAAHGPALAAAIVDAFGPHLTEDPAYDVETAPDYRMNEVMQAVPPAKARALLAETCRDFRTAGEATRAMIVLLTAPAPAPPNNSAPAKARAVPTSRRRADVGTS